MIGQDIQCAHLPSNSHSESISASKWRENEPNRQTIIFEAEWSGSGDQPSDAVLIRNIGECPEPLVKRIREHYRRLKEAITTGKYLDTHFADTKKWCDVWNAAIKNGAPVVLPAVFEGNLYVYGSSKLDAPALTKVGGNLYVDGSSKLDAPALTKVGGNLYVDGSSKLDAPALTKVGGNLYVDGSSKLDAPALTKVGGNLYVDGSSKLDAPALTKVGGDLYVDGSSKLDAPALTKVGGDLYVDGSSKLDAPALTKVGGDLYVDLAARSSTRLPRSAATSTCMALRSWMRQP
jgi:prefoldin subunit 5